MLSPRADRAQREIMDQLTKLEESQRATEDGLKNLTKEFKGLQEWLENVLLNQSRSLPAAPNLHRETSGEASKATKPSRFLAGTPTQSPSLQQRHSYPAVQESKAAEVNFYNGAENATIGDVTMGPLVVDHITGAHRLLTWESIKPFVPAQYSENYVMQHEIKKGLLRIYGKGQGPDNGDMIITGPGSPASHSSSSKSDDYTRSPAPSPPDLWGSNLGTPNIVNGKYYNDSPDHPGGLNPDGSLKVDPATLDSLRESYLNYMHIMHPFLDKAHLKRMFDRFNALVNPSDLRSP